MDFDYQRMCSTSSGIGCYGERSIPTMENRLLGYPLSLDFLSTTSSNPLKHCRSDKHDIDRESRDGLLKLTKGESFTEPRSLHSDHYSHPLISTSNNTASLPNNMQEVLPNSIYNGDPRFITDPVSSIRNSEPYQHMLPISTQMHFSSLPYSTAPSAGGLPLSMYYRDPLFSQLPGCQEIGDVGMTVSQRAELFHHTLIYRYMRSGRSIPLELLNPIRNSVALLNGYASYAMFPSGAAWGGYHLGLSNSCTDLEPGRCRRTDGKKWRCSKEVVPDQKYCDRHMHRGRHRGKKLHTAATSDINGTSVLTEPTQSISSCPTTTATTAAQDHNPETGKNGSSSAKQFNRFLMCSAEDDHEDRHAASSRSGTSYQLTTSSPDSPTLSLSSLKRSTSREDSIQMGLAVAGMGLANRSNMAMEDEHPLIHSEQEQDEEHAGATINFWIPVAWDNSRQADVAGGPLGEVLHHSTTPLGPSNKTNFDIRTDAWENNPRIPDGHQILA